MRALLLQAAIKRFERFCSVDVTLYMPDRRERDIDNLLKALLDALEHGGLIKSDSTSVVRELRVRASGFVSGGAAVVTIREM